MDAAQAEQLMAQMQALQAEHANVVQQLQQAQAQLAAAAQVAGPEAAHAIAPAPVTLKMPKPPVFSGRNREPSPQNWSYQMENYLLANGVDLATPQAATYAAGYLADAALTWHRMHLADVARGLAQNYPSWAEFQAALITRFTPISPERTAREKLTTLRQGKSVRAYAQEFNLCMIELPLMEERDRLYRFLEGLKPEVRIHVELQNPTTLAQAIQLAIQTDSILWQVKKGPSLVGRSTYREAFRHDTNPGPQPMELGAMENRGGQERNNSSIRCFYCHRLGHIKRDCPKRKERMAREQSGN
jgi:hypothetical protein